MIGKQAAYTACDVVPKVIKQNECNEMNSIRFYYQSGMFISKQTP